ncbi:hypothetical protein B0H13DRAFT_2355068 [Mycena leptocephala]|nr:hypothetical protein B0H13DRAFT_2355068 [Mycena leptocephala]
MSHLPRLTSPTCAYLNFFVPYSSTAARAVNRALIQYTHASSAPLLDDSHGSVLSPASMTNLFSRIRSVLANSALTVALPSQAYNLHRSSGRSAWLPSPAVSFTRTPHAPLRRLHRHVQHECVPPASRAALLLINAVDAKRLTPSCTSPSAIFPATSASTADGVAFAARHLGGLLVEEGRCSGDVRCVRFRGPGNGAQSSHRRHRTGWGVKASRSWNGKMVVRWRARWTALVLLRSRVRAPFFRFLLRCAFPSSPLPNVTELLSYLCPLCPPDVPALASIPVQHHLAVVALAVLENTKLESVTGGCTPSAPRDGGPHCPHPDTNTQGSSRSVTRSARRVVRTTIASQCPLRIPRRTPPSSQLALTPGVGTPPTSSPVHQDCGGSHWEVGERYPLRACSVLYLFIRTFRVILLPCPTYGCSTHPGTVQSSARWLLPGVHTVLLRHRPRSMCQRNHAPRSSSPPSRCSTAPSCGMKPPIASAPDVPAATTARGSRLRPKSPDRAQMPAHLHERRFASFSSSVCLSRQPPAHSSSAEAVDFHGRFSTRPPACTSSSRRILVLVARAGQREEGSHAVDNGLSTAYAMRQVRAVHRHRGMRTGSSGTGTFPFKSPQSPCACACLNTLRILLRNRNCA